jgi:hypothetical protein
MEGKQLWTSVRAGETHYNLCEETYRVAAEVIPFRFAFLRHPVRIFVLDWLFWLRILPYTKRRKQLGTQVLPSLSPILSFTTCYTTFNAKQLHLFIQQKTISNAPIRRVPSHRLGDSGSVLFLGAQIPALCGLPFIISLHA